VPKNQPKTDNARKASPIRKASPKRWSQRVTQEKRRARSQARQAPRRCGFAEAFGGHSLRRKAGAYRSALSMLTFYINRRQEAAEDATCAAGTREDRVEASSWKGVTIHRRPASEARRDPYSPAVVLPRRHHAQSLRHLKTGQLHIIYGDKRARRPGVWVPARASLAGTTMESLLPSKLMLQLDLRAFSAHVASSPPPAGAVDIEVSIDRAER